LEFRLQAVRIKPPEGGTPSAFSEKRTELATPISKAKTKLKLELHALFLSTVDRSAV
jgi:hypothetical protein